MYAICLRYTKNTDDAQDMLQDGFMKVFLNLKNFRSEGSFEGWIRRIMVNTILEKFRKGKAIQFQEELDSAVMATESFDVLDNISVEEIMSIVSQLAPGYRTVFNLYAVDGYTHKEIADELGISEGTSKSQLARARKIIQENLLKISTRYEKFVHK